MLAIVGVVLAVALSWIAGADRILVSRGETPAAVDSPVVHARARPVPSDSQAPRDALRGRIRKFEDAWRRTWQEDEVERHGVINLILAKDNTNRGDAGLRRLWAIDCIRRSPAIVPLENASPIMRRPVPTSANARGMCPMWLPPLDSLPRDEAENIDFALSPDRTRDMRRQRDELLRELAAVHARFSRDWWVAGQRVRFLIDQARYGEAVEVARRCGGDRATCTATLGLALAYADRLVESDSAFRVADALQRVASSRAIEICLGADVHLLFAEAERPRIALLDCEKQAQLASTLWWLADPLWSIPGNERLVAHGARRAMLRLRALDVRDERYVWVAGAGGNAMRETVIRYGWPSHTFWAGFRIEQCLAIELEGRPGDLGGGGTTMAARMKEFAEWPQWMERCTPIPNPDRPAANRLPPSMASGRKFPPVNLEPLREVILPFTVKEYAPGRSALLPALDALLDPFTLGDSHWNLRDPNPADPDFWWPQEHMDLRTSLLPLDSGQTVFWRRDSLLAYHLAVDDPLRGAAGSETAIAVLAGGQSGETTQLLTQAEAGLGRTLRFDAEVTSAPMVVSAELLLATTADHAPARALRHRFGVRPPPALRAMRADELALSAPALLRVPRGAEVPRTPEAVLPLLAGSLDFARSDPVGLYWESYGFRPGDTLDVSVTVRRDDDRSFARRVAGSVGLAADLRDSITVRWTEPDARHGASVIAGTVPVIGRALSLDLAALPAGRYLVTVEMRTRTGAGARSSRGLVLRD